MTIGENYAIIILTASGLGLNPSYVNESMFYIKTKKINPQ
jgi:hypothetical protein